MEPVLPSDRGHLQTEQRLDAATSIDDQSIEQTLRLINAQDNEVPGIVERAIPAIAKLVEAITTALRRGGRLIYVGAGTSGRLGVLDASECPPTFHSDPAQVIGLIAGGDAALRRSSEGKEDDPEGAWGEMKGLQVGPDDVVVGIAAGGTTPYVWGGLRFAKEQGAATGLVCCVPLESLGHAEPPLLQTEEACLMSSSPSATVDYPVQVIVGPEVVTGSTRMKSGTATKLVLNMMTTTAMIQLGKVWGNLMVDLCATNRKLRDRAIRIICSQCDLDRQAAGNLLEEAGGHVKLALVMVRLGKGVAEAERLLEAQGSQLRPLLGPPR